MSAPTDNHAVNVLIVDDDHDTRKVIEKLIQPIGVNVLTAEDGAKALAMIQGQQIDVVISDLVMPKMSGMMLLHSILEAGYQIPFIFTTGFADTDSAVQALRLGAFDYLEKPISADDLRTVLNEALRVSGAQKSLKKQLSNFDSPVHAESNHFNAQLSIMRMRTIRMDRSDSPDTDEIQTAKEDATEIATLNWTDLVDLFVSESEAQLTFAKNALRGPEELKPSINYLLRVCRSIREASQTLKLSHIGDLGGKIEQSLAAASLCTHCITPDDISTIENGLQQLEQTIASLTDDGVNSLKKKLEELSERLIGQDAA